MAFWFTWKPPVKNSRKGVKVIKYIPMWCTCHCKLATASINLSRELPNRKKHILYIFVHFVHVHFGKNLVAMYINVVGPPPEASSMSYMNHDTDNILIWLTTRRVIAWTVRYFVQSFPLSMAWNDRRFKDLSVDFSMRGAIDGGISNACWDHEFSHR